MLLELLVNATELRDGLLIISPDLTQPAVVLIIRNFRLLDHRILKVKDVLKSKIGPLNESTLRLLLPICRILLAHNALVLVLVDN